MFGLKIVAGAKAMQRSLSVIWCIYKQGVPLEKRNPSILCRGSLLSNLKRYRQSVGNTHRLVTLLTRLPLW